MKVRKMLLLVHLTEYHFQVVVVIPDDLSKILVFPTIIIAYDNDESGRKGALKLAEKSNQSHQAPR